MSISMHSHSMDPLTSGEPSLALSWECMAIAPTLLCCRKVLARRVQNCWNWATLPVWLQEHMLTLIQNWMKMFLQLMQRSKVRSLQLQLGGRIEDGSPPKVLRGGGSPFQARKGDHNDIWLKVFYLWSNDFHWLDECTQFLNLLEFCVTFVCYWKKMTIKAFFRIEVS